MHGQSDGERDNQGRLDRCKWIIKRMVEQG